METYKGEQFPSHLSNKPLKFCGVERFVAKRNQYKANIDSIRRDLLNGNPKSQDFYDRRRGLMDRLMRDGFYALLHEVMMFHKLEDTLFEVATATETNLNAKDCNYAFDLSRQSLFNMLVHPEFDKIDTCIFNKIFIEISSVIVHDDDEWKVCSQWQMRYGLFLLLFPQRILRYIESKTTAELKINIMEIITKRPNGCIDTMDLLSFIRKFKKCVKSEEIVDIGMSYLETGIQLNYGHIYYEFLIYSLKKIKQNKNNKINKMRDLVINLILLSNSHSHTLYQNVIISRALSNLYYYQRKYWMGYKSLQTAYTLANGYILQKSFIQTDYKIKKRKFIKKLKKSKCDNCNIKYQSVSLKPCFGCCKVAYCSKKCQKIHWNKIHNKQCDKEWEGMHCVSLIKNDSKFIKHHKEEIYFEGISIIHPDPDIDLIQNKKETVAEKTVILKVIYPCIHTFLFEIKRTKDITNIEMAKAVCNIYKQIYQREQETATIKEIEMKSDGTERNTTNGIYGICEHWLSDLTLYAIFRDRSNVYSLGVDSCRCSDCGRCH